jgi:two-component sensor histidine kinase
LFTGKGREEVAIRALNLGAEGYFNKQGDPETVYGELSHGIQQVFKQKVAEKKSKEEETLRTTLLDNVPCIALILEKDTRKIMFSNKYAKEIGAVPGKTCYGTCAKRSKPCLFCLAPKYWETREPQSLEVEFEGKYYRGLWMPYNENLYVHYIFDITERKMAEEKQKESYAQMEAMNEKLRIIGGLTRHDVRNKLFVMNSDLYLLKKSHADQPDLVEGVRRVQQTIKEIDRVFDFSKAYEQLGAEELRYVDVEKAINEAVESFKSTSGIKIANDCIGLSLFADSLLNQVFYTLFDNSIKHGKKTTIVRFYFEKADRGDLNLIYVDDGVGVPDANKSKIFNLGFSTYGSSGFGLYLIRRLMEVYGWTIEENGVYGNGAKFTISIPKISQSGKKNFQIK